MICIDSQRIIGRIWCERRAVTLGVGVPGGGGEGGGSEGGAASGGGLSALIGPSPLPRGTAATRRPMEDATVVQTNREVEFAVTFFGRRPSGRHAQLVHLVTAA